MAKKIKLTQNQYALIDKDEFININRFSWFVSKIENSYYVRRWCVCPLVKQRCMIFMHRQIMSAPHNKDVDHKDHNPLNNQKINLRICNRSQHNCNRMPRKGKYKGVNMDKKTNKPRARITYNGKLISLGCFNSNIEAAKAYDKAAKEYFGEFACVNFSL